MRFKLRLWKTFTEQDKKDFIRDISIRFQFYNYSYRFTDDTFEFESYYSEAVILTIARFIIDKWPVASHKDIPMICCDKVSLRNFYKNEKYFIEEFYK
jgi:hypothetical protein